MDAFRSPAGLERVGSINDLDRHVARAAATLGWGALALGAPVALLVLLVTGMHLSPASLMPLGLSLALLIAGHIRYQRFAPDLRLSLATGTLAMVIGAGTLAGIISHIGLRLQRPLIDSRLLQLDRFALIDTERLVLAFGGRPIILGILEVAYASAVPLCIWAVLYQSYRGRAFRVWEAAASFAFCILSASVSGAFFPAVGNIAQAGIDPLAAGLPTGAGVYHLPVFDALYRGQDEAFDIGHLTGVVTFPSFHLVMALIPVWAFRGGGLFAALAAGWGLLIAVSTIPIGGHYLVDLVAGFTLWGVGIIAIRTLARLPSRPRPVSSKDWTSHRPAGPTPEAVG